MSFIRFWGRYLSGPLSSFGPGVGSYNITTYTDNATLTQADMNAIHRMNSASNKQFTLPTITAGMIGDWFIFRKVNTGNVTIARAGSDTIQGATSISCTTTDTDSFIVLYAAALATWEVNAERGQWSS